MEFKNVFMKPYLGKRRCLVSFSPRSIKEEKKQFKRALSCSFSVKKYTRQISPLALLI